MYPFCRKAYPGDGAQKQYSGCKAFFLSSSIGHTPPKTEKLTQKEEDTLNPSIAAFPALFRVRGFRLTPPTTETLMVIATYPATSKT